MRRLLLAALAAAAVLLTADTPPPRLAPRVGATYVTARGFLLRAAVGGEGAWTVFLLHGYGESLTAWRPVFDLLQSRFRVVALDMPGFGLSAKPDSGYSVAEIGATVASAIRQLSERPVALVGHSMGGAVAGWIAAHEPDLLDRLVLVDAAGLPGPVLSRAGQLSPTAVAALFGIGAALRSPHDPNWLAESDSALAYHPSADERYYSALNAMLREFDFTSLDTLLPVISQPTLVLWGRHDATTPLENGERFAREIRASHLTIVEGALHRPHVTHPEAVARAIASFLGSPD